MNQEYTAQRQLSQSAALDFAGGALGQFREESNPFWHLIIGQPPAAEFPQFFLARFVAIPERQESHHALAVNLVWHEVWRTSA